MWLRFRSNHTGPSRREPHGCSRPSRETSASCQLVIPSHIRFPIDVVYMRTCFISAHGRTSCCAPVARLCQTGNAGHPVYGCPCPAGSFPRRNIQEAQLLCGHLIPSRIPLPSSARNQRLSIITELDGGGGELHSRGSFPKLFRHWTALGACRTSPAPAGRPWAAGRPQVGTRHFDARSCSRVKTSL